MTCSCDLIPLYIGSLFFGILIALMASPNNAVSNSVEYMMNSYETFIYDGMHNPSGIPNALLTSPFFYGIIILVGYWKRYDILNMPHRIVYQIQNISKQQKLETEKQ